jgi:1-acyl-sn-glycerol-3-phosphate acyltransferase
VTVAPFAPLFRPAATGRPSPAVDAATRRRRWLRLVGTVAGTAAGAVRAPVTGTRGRRRLVVCGAARALTALGVRVEVRAATVAWPRSGPGHLVVVADRLGWLEALALLTAVPGLPIATPEVAGWPVLGRLVRRSGVVVLDAAGRATLPTAAGDPAAPICPVEVRGAPATSTGRLTWRGLAAVVAARDVVVAVRLLPPLTRAPAGRLARDVRS